MDDRIESDLSEESLIALAATLRAGAPLTAEEREDALCALGELRAWRARRAQDDIRRLSVGAHRVIVEGFSDDSAAGAFADAMDKALHYFSEHHDVSMTLLGLVDLPCGGHRATLEIHITPMNMTKTAHLESPDLELKHIHDRAEAGATSRADHHIEHLVQDHFMMTCGAANHFIPDYFMINLTDAQILNHMIEKQFFKACNPATLDNIAPQLRVRLRRSFGPEFNEE